MSPRFMAGRSRCAAACPGCSARFKRQFLIAFAFSLLLAALVVVAALFNSRPLQIAILVAIVPTWLYGRRALRAWGEVQAAEETARRYGGRR